MKKALKFETYFETQNSALNEFYRYIDEAGYLHNKLTGFECVHINYDSNHSYHLPLYTIKNQLAKKQAHAFICRLSSGRYELTMYIN